MTPNQRERAIKSNARTLELAKKAKETAAKISKDMKAARDSLGIKESSILDRVLVRENRSKKLSSRDWGGWVVHQDGKFDSMHKSQSSAEQRAAKMGKDFSVVSHERWSDINHVDEETITETRKKTAGERLANSIPKSKSKTNKKTPKPKFVVYNPRNGKIITAGITHLHIAQAAAMAQGHKVASHAYWEDHIKPNIKSE